GHAAPPAPHDEDRGRDDAPPWNRAPQPSDRPAGAPRYEDRYDGVRPPGAEPHTAPDHGRHYDDAEHRMPAGGRHPADDPLPGQGPQQYDDRYDDRYAPVSSPGGPYGP